MYKCKFCGKEYEKNNELGGHVANCPSNPNKQVIKTFKKVFNLKCEKCGADYEIFDTQNNVDKRKHKKNCSVSCSKSRIRSEETKQKISKTLILTNNLDKTKTCPFCKKEYLYDRKKQIFCSKTCQAKNNNKNGAAVKGGKASAKVSVKRSKNEIAFGEKCKELFENIGFNENFFNGWDADIILHDVKIAIMWNGIWHYEQVREKHSVKQVQNRDNIKIKEIEKSGYIPYIIKDMGKYSEKKVNLEWDIFLNWLNEKNILVI